mmetsp:Transcript_9196/g.24830  ORF Transcript_9196/g.24830 Transcript_9196/m.24830 type:complete len:210 (-) Transcript_9196:137-766(-)
MATDTGSETPPSTKCGFFLAFSATKARDNAFASGSLMASISSSSLFSDVDGLCISDRAMWMAYRSKSTCTPRTSKDETTTLSSPAMMMLLRIMSCSMILTARRSKSQCRGLGANVATASSSSLRGVSSKHAMMLLAHLVGSLPSVKASPMATRCPSTVNASMEGASSNSDSDCTISFAFSKRTAMPAPSPSSAFRNCCESWKHCSVKMA